MVYYSQYCLTMYSFVSIHLNVYLLQFLCLPKCGSQYNRQLPRTGTRHYCDVMCKDRWCRLPVRYSAPQCSSDPSSIFLVALWQLHLSTGRHKSVTLYTEASALYMVAHNSYSTFSFTRREL